MDFQSFKGKVTQVPTREDIQLTANEQLIVELYSK
jgi:ribosomal protein S4